METVPIDEFLVYLEAGRPVFDARTPAEFAKGHLPGARNLALFDDEERAQVGTIYKQQSRRAAILEGLDIVGPKMRRLVEEVESSVGPPPADILVHCWRGGMRSASLAWLLEFYDYQVCTLAGGYKSFRRWVLDQLDRMPPLIVVGGYTGSGKTEILSALAARGEMVIDLEELAGHRGSAFGGLQLPEQPTQQQFENQLATEISWARQSGRPVWIEDESRLIGRRALPKAMIEAKRIAPVLFVEASTEARVERLLGVYGDASADLLRQGFHKIRKRLGGLRTKQAMQAVDDGNLADAAEIALNYYDQAYDYGLSHRRDERIHRLTIDGGPGAIADALIEFHQTISDQIAAYDLCEQDH